MTEKGTVRRGTTLGQYSEEIQALYRDFEVSAHAVILPPTLWDSNSATDYVRAIVCHVMGPVSDDTDIFDVGCARSVTGLTHRLLLIELL